MDDLDLAKAAQSLIHLREEHRDLDAAIDTMRAAQLPDELAITRMKKRKLALKDAIARLESSLIPDQPA